MNLAVLDISTYEPVSLPEAKNFLGLHESFQGDDSLINQFIAAAREQAENYCNRSFVQKKYRLAFGRYISSIKLPRAPLAKVDKVQYISSGNMVEYSEQNFSVNNMIEPPRLLLNLPVSADNVFNAIQVDYYTGYRQATNLWDDPEQEPDPNAIPLPEMPETVRTAILMIVRTMYDHRDDIVKGTIVFELPRSSRYLLNDYRIHEF